MIIPELLTLMAPFFYKVLDFSLKYRLAKQKAEIQKETEKREIKRSKDMIKYAQTGNQCRANQKLLK
jgi:hypothetical protein